MLILLTRYTICKQVLGVQNKTTNIGVLLELGRIPLRFDAIKLSIKNWERIRKQNANVILLASYVEASELNLPWISDIKKHLESNGMLSLFLNAYTNKPIFVYKKIYQRLSDIFHQESLETIKNRESKLRTYGLLKRDIGLENYHIDINNPNIRRSVSKFRLSNHSLLIETGRFKKIQKELRYCPFCTRTVESEIHFLIHCPTYQAFRLPIMQQAEHKIPGITIYTDKQKFQ